MSKKPVIRHTSNAPITVIGAGIVGLCTALSLLKQGQQVCIIDPGNLADSCSYGNAGSLSSGSVAPLGMPGVFKNLPKWLLDEDAPLHVRREYWLKVFPWLTRFVLSSRPVRVEQISFALKELLSPSVALYQTLLHELGAENLLSQCGQLQLYPSQQYRQADAAVWQLRKRRGVKLEYVERQDIEALEPAIGPRYVCGVFIPDEGMILNPGRLLEALHRQIIQLGGQIIHGKAHGFHLEGDQVDGVITDNGTIATCATVLAAGAWSARLAQQLGDKLPLQTQRGYHVSLPSAGIQLGRPVVATDRKYFVSPMEHELRIAGTVEFDSLDAPAHFERAEILLRQVQELLPDIQTTQPGYWMGHRPCFPDSLPVIDRASHVRNVVYAFGNGHLGLTAGPMMGRQAGKMIVGQKPDIQLQPFGLDRF